MCGTRVSETYMYMFVDTILLWIVIDGMPLPLFNVAASVDNTTMMYLAFTVQIYCDPQSSWDENGTCGHRIIGIVLLQADYDYELK